jgi:hypothetical protein
VLHLPEHERAEVRRVQAVAHLVPGAAEADVAQRAPAQVRVDPVRVDALRRVPELPGAGEHAAPVHPDGEPERVVVLESERLRGELRRAVQGDRGRRGELLTDAALPEPDGQRRIERGAECRVVHLDRQRGQRRDRVDAARAQQHEPRRARLAVLEHVHRAEQIVIDQLPAARAPVHAGEHAGVRRGVDHPVGRAARVEVGGGADVAVQHLHAELREDRAVELAAGARQVVEADDRQDVGRALRPEVARQRAPDEAAHPGDQDPHAAPCFARSASWISSKMSSRLFVMSHDG